MHAGQRARCTPFPSLLAARPSTMSSTREFGPRSVGMANPSPPGGNLPPPQPLRSGGLEGLAGFPLPNIVHPSLTSGWPCKKIAQNTMHIFL